jgi:Immunity protein 52
MIPSEPTFPKSIFHIPWIAYLSAPLAIAVNLSPEITTERTPDGGLLMSATTERLDPNNPEHVRRARILAETLIACTDYQRAEGPRVW